MQEILVDLVIFISCIKLSIDARGHFYLFSRSKSRNNTCLTKETAANKTVELFRTEVLLHIDYRVPEISGQATPPLNDKEATLLGEWLFVGYPPMEKAKRGAWLIDFKGKFSNVVFV